MFSEVPDLRTVSCSQATLLSPPIGDIEYTNTCILTKVNLLKVMDEILSFEASFQLEWDLAINDITNTRLLAVSCAESGAWLNTLPLLPIGLRMDDVIRIAVDLRLGLTLCSAHTCSGCGGDAQEDGVHGLSCRYSRGIILDMRPSTTSSSIYLMPPKFHLIWSHRACTELMENAQMEPQLFHGKEEKHWYGTQRARTLAFSHRDVAVQEPGALAAAAKHRKMVKYSHRDATHHFVPFAMESLGVLGCVAHGFLCDLTRIVSGCYYPVWKRCSCFGDDWEYGKQINIINWGWELVL